MLLLCVGAWVQQRGRIIHRVYHTPAETLYDTNPQRRGGQSTHHTDSPGSCGAALVPTSRCTRIWSVSGKCHTDNTSPIDANCSFHPDQEGNSRIRDDINLRLLPCVTRSPSKATGLAPGKPISSNRHTTASASPGPSTHTTRVPLAKWTCTMQAGRPAGQEETARQCTR